MIKKLSACTSILIGKKATIDGTIIIGRNEDAKAAWPKRVEIHPRDSMERLHFQRNEADLATTGPQRSIHGDPGVDR